MDHSKLRTDFEGSNFWNFIGLEIDSLEVGAVKLRLPYNEKFVNVRNTIHGGIYASLLDTTMGMTARSLGSREVATLQLSINFLKSLKEENLYSAANVVKKTNSTALIEAKIYDSNNETAAHATGTFKL
ncbi:PaaI family thioesterase [Halalkalibacillus sediminis]|uniref:Medium/long-chain acyl-CoA thioesterase YigI n=1 Tax=Halalkalibacillus sediminis TaxID=2018042 RepID=A0A2I0QUB8_9BACI|nr:PaaI family thioesterase [Halalkalibacillus sediminis]PKR77894.1 PaaI family thioesterase [Halalkalibacillus sediminis]